MEAFHSPIGIYGFPTITTIWMDSRIWSRLPEKLIDRIIAFLPPPAFFRARSVCKRWYNLLFSTTFLQLYLQISPHFHWFIFFKHNNTLKSYNIYSGNNEESRAREIHEGYLFDPYTLTWYRLSFPLIPPGFSPASSSGGLIGWVSDEAGSKNILLSNPIVGSSSLIPIPPTLKPRLFPSIGLNIANTPSSIDLVVAGDDLTSPYAVKNLTTESFHVDANGFYSIWGTTSSLPRLTSFESRGKMVFADGRFYCMNSSPFSVLSYHISTNTWCKIQAPMRRFLRSPSLVESGGRLLMVAAVEKSKLNVPKSLRLWALQHCGQEPSQKYRGGHCPHCPHGRSAPDCGTMWVEMERMPQHLFMHFSQVEDGQGFKCVAHGDFLLILINNSHKGMLFDFCTKTWLWLPPFPFLHQLHSSSFELHGFAYQPKLATPVTALLHQLTLPFQSFSG